ncbi:MAG TPA: acyltransferase [Candidatus Acidoferrum sp.]|jgi:peptidoglycan/LPS O-acetylase OafA/YrhL|nr:acyltransferase [Candidatus Acidoferrum sp.]
MNSTAASRSYDFKSRLVGLDILRFAAISVVLCDHSNNFGPAGDLFIKTPGILGVVLSTVSSMGWVAVDVFFVLSGFLVSSLFFQEVARTGSVSPGRFLVRRGFKIYPAFWIMIAATIGYTWCRGGKLAWIQVFGELFFFQNYGHAVTWHTWSLAVEEHFYFVLAGLFWLVRWRTKPGGKVNLHWVPDLCLAVAVACLISRFIMWLTIMNVTSDNSFWFRCSDLSLIDSLFFGMLLSYFWHHAWSDLVKKRLMSCSVPLAITGIVLLLPFWTDVMGIQWFRLFGYVMLYLGAGSLLIGSLALDYYGCPRWVRAVAWLGQYSYSVYLWHLLCGHVVFPLLSVKLDPDNRLGWTLNALIYFVSTWLVGILLARLIEFPVIRLRDRWFPAANEKRS